MGQNVNIYWRRGFCDPIAILSLVCPIYQNIYESEFVPVTESFQFIILGACTILYTLHTKFWIYSYV